jgi:hypothetical protein
MLWLVCCRAYYDVISCCPNLPFLNIQNALTSQNSRLPQGYHLARKWLGNNEAVLVVAASGNSDLSCLGLHWHPSKHMIWKLKTQVSWKEVMILNDSICLQEYRLGGSGVRVGRLGLKFPKEEFFSMSSLWPATWSDLCVTVCVASENIISAVNKVCICALSFHLTVLLTSF